MQDHMLEELFFFDDSTYPDFIFEYHFKRPNYGLLIKTTENFAGDLDETILQIIYGNMKKYPGDEDSISKTATKMVEGGKECIGVWAPRNINARAVALKLFFPNLTAPYRLPDYKPIPLHVAMAFDAFKARDVFALSEKHPGEVMKFGFFTSDAIGEAKLISKTLEEWKNRPGPASYEEKLVLQLSKEREEVYKAFKELRPSYTSINALEGEEDCKYFFPHGYDEPAKASVEVKKKGKKKKAKMVAQNETTDDNTETRDEMQSTDVDLGGGESEDNLGPDEETDGEEQKETEGGGEEDVGEAQEADKATSPHVDEEATLIGTEEKTTATQEGE